MPHPRKALLLDRVDEGPVAHDRGSRVVGKRSRWSARLARTTVDSENVHARALRIGAALDSGAISLRAVGDSIRATVARTPPAKTTVHSRSPSCGLIKEDLPGGQFGPEQ
jgi:hypothetical protein